MLLRAVRWLPFPLLFSPDGPLCISSWLRVERYSAPQYLAQSGSVQGSLAWFSASVLSVVGATAWHSHYTMIGTWISADEYMGQCGSVHESAYHCMPCVGQDRAWCGARSGWYLQAFEPLSVQLVTGGCTPGDASCSALTLKLSLTPQHISAHLGLILLAPGESCMLAVVPAVTKQASMQS